MPRGKSKLPKNATRNYVIKNNIHVLVYNGFIYTHEKNLNLVVQRSKLPASIQLPPPQTGKAVKNLGGSQQDSARAILIHQMNKFYSQWQAFNKYGNTQYLKRGYIFQVCFLKCRALDDRQSISFAIFFYILKLAIHT